MIDVARLRIESGDTAQARDLLEQAIELGTTARGTDDRQVVSARERLADLNTGG